MRENVVDAWYISSYITSIHSYIYLYIVCMYVCMWHVHGKIPHGQLQAMVCTDIDLDGGRGGADSGRSKQLRDTVGGTAHTTGHTRGYRAGGSNTHLSDGDEVLERFGHLEAVDGEMARVEEVVDAAAAVVVCLDLQEEQL